MVSKFYGYKTVGSAWQSFRSYRLYDINPDIMGNWREYANMMSLFDSPTSLVELASYSRNTQGFRIATGASIPHYG